MTTRTYQIIKGFERLGCVCIRTGSKRLPTLVVIFKGVMLFVETEQRSSSVIGDTHYYCDHVDDCKQILTTAMLTFMTNARDITEWLDNK